jgi:dephospho-CoA kinase
VQRIGLTGGIASGKSAVAAMLRDLGFRVLEADAVSHNLMEPGLPAYDEIIREFGTELLGADGRIDRAKLASIVFAAPKKLAKLNTILHPRVEEMILRQFEEWRQNGVRDAVFVEAALLVEAGMTKNLDGLVVVWCKPEQQVERLRARGINEIEAERRISAQLPLEEKLKHATVSINCSGTVEETRAQVDALAAKLRHGSPTG